MKQKYTNCESKQETKKRDAKERKRQLKAKESINKETKN